jgi:hypothetical protein
MVRVLHNLEIYTGTHRTSNSNPKLALFVEYYCMREWKTDVKIRRQRDGANVTVSSALEMPPHLRLYAN